MLFRLRGFLSISLFLAVVVSCVQNSAAMSMPGGVRDVQISENSLELDDIGRFAVNEHNKRTNAQLEFRRVISCKKQVVAGTRYQLVLEAVEGSDKKEFVTDIWERPWLNSKELRDFKYVKDVPPTDSPPVTGEEGKNTVGNAGNAAILAAARHAVRTIQERSNSLLPYDLQDVMHADHEMVGGASKFDMVLKVKRGSKEEQFKVVVDENNEGVFHTHTVQSHNPLIPQSSSADVL